MNSKLFRRLSVFVSSFSLAAAEQVCGQVQAAQDERTAGKRQDMMEHLSGLLDKSMLQCLEQEGEEALPRFPRSETSPVSALRRVCPAGGGSRLARAYTDYYLALAEATEPPLQVPLLTQERENVLNALQWLLATGQGEAAVRLSSALWFFWWMLGLLDEGPAFLEQALATSGDISQAGTREGACRSRTSCLSFR